MCSSRDGFQPSHIEQDECWKYGYVIFCMINKAVVYVCELLSNAKIDMRAPDVIS